MLLLMRIKQKMTLKQKMTSKQKMLVQKLKGLFEKQVVWVSDCPSSSTPETLAVELVAIVSGHLDRVDLLAFLLKQHKPPVTFSSDCFLE